MLMARNQSLQVLRPVRREETPAAAGSGSGGRKEGRVLEEEKERVVVALL